MIEEIVNKFWKEDFNDCKTLTIKSIHKDIIKEMEKDLQGRTVRYYKIYTNIGLEKDIDKKIDTYCLHISFDRTY